EPLARGAAPHNGKRAGQAALGRGPRNLRHTSAQAVPALQPASTSEGQCTPRKTRLSPTTTIIATAAATTNRRAAGLDCPAAASAPTTRKSVAVSMACALGKLGV